MNKIYLIIVLSLSSIIASGQDYIDLAKFNYAYSSVGTFDSGMATTRLQEMNGDLSVPLVLNDKFAFLTGIAYENIIASFNPDREEESVTGLTLKLGANIKHNSKWSGTYMLLPKVSSDLEKISSRDFQLGGAILMKYIKTNRFNYNLGVYANSDLFGPFIVPLLGFYYLNPSDKLEVKVLLPLSADLNYSVTESVRFGLNFLAQIRSYNLNTPIGTETNRYLSRSSKDLYTYFQYEMKNGINFQLGIGKSIGRTYRIYDEKVSFGMPLIYFGDNRTQLNTDFSDSWLLKATIFYRLKLETSS